MIKLFQQISDYKDNNPVSFQIDGEYCGKKNA
jgi:hypothetical protein